MLNINFTVPNLKPFRAQAARFLGLAERCGRVLSDESAREIYNAGYKFCHRYVALSVDATRLDS